MAVVTLVLTIASVVSEAGSIAPTTPQQSVHQPQSQPRELSHAQRIASLTERLQRVTAELAGFQLDLMAAESYVRLDPVTWRQAFDTARAAEGGMSTGAMELIQEMATYQNELFVCTEDLNAYALELRDLPRVANLYRLATERVQLQTRLQELSAPESTYTTYATLWHPCGAWLNPTPNSSPPRTYFNAGDPHAVFRQWGFHKTADYAGGGSGRDYTRGRSYGSCDSPRFRDHGYVHDNGRASIQYGEPNPEIRSYWPPYWDWPTYVYWWHRTY